MDGWMDGLEFVLNNYLLTNIKWLPFLRHSVRLHCESKTRHSSFRHNFGLIFKFLSLTT